MKLCEISSNGLNLDTRANTPEMSRLKDKQLPAEFCRGRTWCELTKMKKLKRKQDKIARNIRNG